MHVPGGVRRFNPGYFAVFDDEALGRRFREDGAFACFNVLDELFNHGRSAALKKVPRHEGFFRAVHRADAAELNAHVGDFINCVFGAFDQYAQYGGIGAEMMVLQPRVQHLLNGRFNAVFFLVAGVDAQRAFREEPGAAQERQLFENDGFDAFFDEGVGGCEPCETAAHNDDVGLFIFHRSHRGWHGTHCGRSSGRTQKLTTIKLHGSLSFFDSKRARRTLLKGWIECRRGKTSVL